MITESSWLVLKCWNELKFKRYLLIFIKMPYEDVLSNDDDQEFQMLTDIGKISLERRKTTFVPSGHRISHYFPNFSTEAGAFCHLCETKIEPFPAHLQSFVRNQNGYQFSIFLPALACSPSTFRTIKCVLLISERDPTLLTLPFDIFRLKIFHSRRPLRKTVAIRWANLSRGKIIFERLLTENFI